LRGLRGGLTRAIRQVVLLALYPILQVLRFTASLLDARLHGLGGDIVRHGDGGESERQLVCTELGGRASEVRGRWMGLEVEVEVVEVVEEVVVVVGSWWSWSWSWGVGGGAVAGQSRGW
jgi:hypothetical protein